MATLNVSQIISGGGTINIAGATSATVFTTGANEIAEVCVTLSAQTFISTNPAIAKLQINGLDIAEASGTSTAGTRAQVGGAFLSSFNGAAAATEVIDYISPSGGIAFKVPPNSTLTAVIINPGSGNTFIRGSYVKYANGS